MTDNTVTIVVTQKDGYLIARCEDEPALCSDSIPWPSRITETSDSWAIAHAVTESAGATILQIEHDNETVVVTVDSMNKAQQ